MIIDVGESPRAKPRPRFPVSPRTAPGVSSRRSKAMQGDSEWIMSSRSTGNGGSCVEARRHAGLIEVRNSKRPEASTVRFTVEEWDSFLDGAKKGEFDRLLFG
jgi:hypothetical protein